ncbi:MAG: bifunctional ornithine acetyltransferase/N-acetylglutamate synthase [Dehalococcoidaceae bacterium]|nr:bifunctional ornithine acetyltransferase/N-acetylglutamate synthase [Dehalococcoidaceae bacterium]
MGNQDQQSKIKQLKNGHVSMPNGFYAEGIAAGIKSNKQKDLAVLYADQPCNFVALYTQNQLKGESLKWTIDLLNDNKPFRGLLVNSGNANTAVGTIGYNHAKELAFLLADKIQADPEEIYIASTGIIGIELPMDLMRTGIEALNLNQSKGDDFAQAILTTDTQSKEVALEIEYKDKKYMIAGCAKGAGMIHPNLATMLAFVTTDVPIDPKWAHQILTESVNLSFNMIDVDMDTSPCDMVALISKQGSKNEIVDQTHPLSALFKEALQKVCIHLAKGIASDGEGATCLIEARINQASSDLIAKNAARSIISSLLIKTMVKGKDPNWGRIITALGNAIPAMNENKISIHIGEIKVYENGKPLFKNAQKAVDEMYGSTVLITIDLNDGNANAVAWGCDLTQEYVKINSEYTT